MLRYVGLGAYNLTDIKGPYNFSLTIALQSRFPVFTGHLEKIIGFSKKRRELLLKNRK